MNQSDSCPVCGPVHNGVAEQFETGPRDSFGFDCGVCGRFEISGTAFAGRLNPERNNLSSIERAFLSHHIRKSVENRSAQPMITTDWLERMQDDAHLPSPAIQAVNIIRFIGDRVSKTGEVVEKLPEEFPAIIGAPNHEFAGRLAKELIERGLLKANDATSHDGIQLLNIDLTLDGWEEYESEKHGHVAGNYGFIAMKFGDEILDPFISETVKPKIKESIGYDLVDLRDVSEAGVIDNIMRSQIRDAAFVIVDLTHDNSGAYWEAGYAEGLGKPVIYICEDTKFEEAKTHFDTNHCTTVLWSEDDPDDFIRELVATLRRSLNLFPESEQ